MGEGRPVIPLQTRELGRTDYSDTWRAMQAFNAARSADTPDELWITEHPPVYTLGLNKRDVQPPLRQDIPLVETDRGGKITYHGPGQLIVYFLIDLKRRDLSIRPLVSLMENAVIALLGQYGIAAAARADAPGVYVENRKIASLGLRVRNGCCYHGLSLNIDMDLSPFDAIDPCGYRGLEVTQTRDLGIPADMATLSAQLKTLLLNQLNRL
ncbi:lipoyl(octanoyl) transferase [Novimethylophilus kurashikiensis]|uniref:Octanoyltransferase n=1 Tax=Novimethylophilus kurashikiensis TaxID=1825523 RepID=A0A2R5F656_9PROT|nr:lipoyl(octanoyl) transferase LipB [Novimethylophilus kurashikiensis]GBG13737.1 lipoyl(octanoyl) transferase [Novimethylophilus kurashikiensis]